MLHGSMTLGIHIYVCTTVELISWSIKSNKTDDYIHKYNGRPFLEEKNLYKSISITIAENTENVYHVTRENLYFAHAPYNKNTN